MNRVEQLHLEAIDKSRFQSVEEFIYEINEAEAASKSAQITEQIAIEFATWCNKPSLEDLRQGNVVYVPSGNFYWHKHKKYTPKELFQEFLKTKTMNNESKLTTMAKSIEERKKVIRSKINELPEVHWEILRYSNDHKKEEVLEKYPDHVDFINKIVFN